MMQQLLRGLPKVDILVEKMDQTQEGKDVSKTFLTCVVRDSIEMVRKQIIQGSRDCLPSEEEMLGIIRTTLHEKRRRSLRPVINATGIVLHTNLGRSVLSEEAARAAAEVAVGYSTLEYRLSEGRRGSRYDHVEELLKKICGCESALVVNNNAAAVLLILSTMAEGRSVVTSRGELVEIGGSFRVPEIMEMSGCRLTEIGTTNKTHAVDYVRGIKEDTALLLKVHNSNFKICGFTESVSLKELSEIAKEHGLPLVYDMGSGSLVSMNHLPGVDEPNAAEALQMGADVVSFSGDKLLGGPQAGIIIGKKTYIDAMKRNPLTRALRVDKMTLAALEVTIRQYLEGDPWKLIPTLRMLSMPKEELMRRGEALFEALFGIPGLSVSEFAEEAPAGGGSMPEVMFPTRCLAVRLKGLSANQLEKKLRELPRPIIARIKDDQILLDVKTISPDEVSAVADGFRLLSKQEGL